MKYELQPAVPDDRVWVVSRLTLGLCEAAAFEGMTADEVIPAAYALATALWRHSTTTVVVVPGRAHAGFLVADRDSQGHILHWIELEPLCRRHGIGKGLVAAMADTPLRVTARSRFFTELVKKHVGKERVVYNPWPTFVLASKVGLDLGKSTGYHRRQVKAIADERYAQQQRVALGRATPLLRGK